MVDIVSIGWFARRLLKKKRGNDGSCLESHRLNGGSFAISCIETTETLCEVLAALSTWELEHILAPFCDGFVSVIDILDELISRAPLEFRGRHQG